MNRRRFLAVTVGVMVLSVGLVLMTDSAQAQVAPPERNNPHAGVTQNWDKNLPSSSRYTVLPSFHNQAVRDNNTGLVWAQAPRGAANWNFAMQSCANAGTGGTFGWRLPSVFELNSVRDLSGTTPSVPASVFTGVQTGLYWSATTWGGDTTKAWGVMICCSAGPTNKISDNVLFWCVRGPMNADTY